ncbi:MAG TPA: 50S ribosomal protein L3 N(5)-glutamine methyltransferase [Xanthobacteraceae bacterium]|nr:50S ribosomal protein L3 N(5)-glutamine methyltransferase [Xanthobacteraceae bacterium]
MATASRPRARTLRVRRPRELTTILDHVRYAVTQFRAAQLVFAHGTADPVAEAAFIVCEALHLPPDRFDVFADARVAHHERKKIFDLIEARIHTRKPAAYLMQKAYLRGVPFYVDERALVPRSYLAEILDGELFAGEEPSLIEDPGAVERVLDLCTGSGCLAVIAAMRFPNAAVDAVDVSADALAVAARNVAEHGLNNRITLHCGDLFGPVHSTRYDVIISNPPYVDTAGMAALPPECRHEPTLALDGGPDGIAVVRRIIDNAGRHLTANAGLLCEVGRDRRILEKTYPQTSFLWLDTEESTGEVLWLDAAQFA